jgi:hypothetical protein
MTCPKDIIESADVSVNVKEAAYDMLNFIEELFGDVYVSFDPEDGCIEFWETDSMDAGMSFSIKDNS